MAQMTKEELYNYLIGKGMVQAGRNPGTLSVDLGDNTGYITQFTTPPGFRESQIADVANPAGFNTPYQTPADWMANIDNMTYVPDWKQALKEADNGGFMADYGWMLPLAIAAGGPMIGGLGAAGTGGAISAAEAAAAMGGGIDAAGWGLGSLDALGAAGGAALGSGISAGSGTGLTFGGEGMLTGEALGSGISGTAGGITGITSGAAGITGATGAIPGIGTLTASGMLIPAAGGAAIPLASASPSILSSVANWASNLAGTPISGAQLLSGGASLLGGLLSGNAAQGAARTSADAQLEAARIAADAAKFRPVGVSTRFGQSQFQKDAQGNVIGAGYTLSPDVKAQQDQLMAASGGMLGQFTGSQATTAPMGQAAQSMFNLGQGYLSTDPQAQAAKYLADQQALLATGRERDLSKLETRLLSQGRLGLATGGTSTGMMAANPEMEALRNAQMQQDLGLAAAATQGGMDYAKFGAGMVGSGGQMLRDMYGTQTASYAPYQTAMQGSQYLEGLGQNALNLGMDIGSITTNAGARSGNLLAQGMTNAANTMQPSNAYSPWGAMLTGAGNTIANMSAQQNPTYDPSKFRLVPFGT